MRKINLLIILIILTSFDKAFGAGGWDWNLTKKCAKSTLGVASPNYYQDTDQCGPSGKNWTLAVESESSFGASCPGPANQSYRIVLMEYQALQLLIG